MLPKSFTSKPWLPKEARPGRVHLPAFRLWGTQLIADGWISHGAQLFYFTVPKRCRNQGQFQGVVWVISHSRSPDIIHNLGSILYFEFIAYKKRGRKLLLTQGWGSIVNLGQTRPLMHSGMKAWSDPILADFIMPQSQALSLCPPFLSLFSFPVDLWVKDSEVVRQGGLASQESPDQSGRFGLGPPWASSR